MTDGHLTLHTLQPRWTGLKRIICRCFGHRWSIQGLTGRYEWCGRCAERRIAPGALRKALPPGNRWNAQSVDVFVEMGLLDKREANRFWTIQLWRDHEGNRAKQRADRRAGLRAARRSIGRKNRR